MRGQLGCARKTHEHTASDRAGIQQHNDAPAAKRQARASQRTGGQLELVGSLEVGVAGLAVGTGVVLEVEKLGEHSEKTTRRSERARQRLCSRHTHAVASQTPAALRAQRRESTRGGRVRKVHMQEAPV
jgi:hypothetical protein